MTYPPPAIELDQVRYSWPGSNEPCLDIPELSVAVGERVFLYGPSGSGKSTLLGVIGGGGNRTERMARGEDGLREARKEADAVGLGGFADWLRKKTQPLRDAVPESWLPPSRPIGSSTTTQPPPPGQQGAAAARARRRAS